VIRCYRNLLGLLLFGMLAFSPAVHAQLAANKRRMLLIVLATEAWRVACLPNSARAASSGLDPAPASSLSIQASLSIRPFQGNCRVRS